MLNVFIIAPIPHKAVILGRSLLGGFFILCCREVYFFGQKRLYKLIQDANSILRGLGTT
jgi:hypothetical protein